MQTCEMCGVQFRPPSTQVEVTSTRILCPPCMAEREAQKRSRAAERTGGRAAVPPTPPPQARPQVSPNSRSAPAAPATPVRVQARANPGATASPRPTSTKAAPKTEAAPRKPAAPADKAKPAAAKKKPAKRDLSPVFREDAERLRKRANRTVLHGFLVVFVLSVIAGVIVWRVLGIKHDEAAAARARAEREELVHKTIMGFQIEDEKQAKELVAFAEDEANLAVWKESDRASEIQGRLAKAKVAVQGFQDRREVTNRFDELAAKVQDGASLTSDDLAQLKRDLETLEARAGIVGPDFVQKLTDTIQDVGNNYSTKLVDEARAAAEDLSSADSARAALAKYARAEEEIQKVLDAAYKAHQADRSNAQITAKKDAAENLYKEVIRESDELGRKVYTEAFIEATPWIDLLSGEWATKWNAATLKGFSHSLENGVLRLVGPDADARGDGIISIGDRELWRDFLLELEVVLHKGGPDLFMRLGRTIDNVESTQISCEGDDAKPKDEPLAVEISFLGSEWSLYVHSDSYDPGSPTSFDVRWVSNREGAIGFGVPSGTDFEVTKARIKVLR